jgi:acetoacetyl-CoA reductase/3-oxoacyl-[acyl-carrier protein] reductase
MTGTITDLVALDGQVAVVGGGAGAIGAATASLLAAAGATVICVDRPGRSGPPHTLTSACDLADHKAVRRLIDALVADHGRLDLVVHCAGITRDRLLWKLTDEDWSAVLSVNLDSAFYLLNSAAPMLRRGGGGSIVLVSSINGERGKMGQANYAASKAGLIGLARTAARELGRFGVRVNTVAPGWIDTPLTAPLGEELRRHAVDETVLARIGQPEDVARAVLFLCSDLSRHITGQVLRVDGGQLIG